MLVGIFIWLSLAWLAGWVAFYRVPFLTGLKKQSGKAPTISIIVPARNEAETVPRLLASIQEQWHQPLEVIVVDDQSDDATAKVAREYGAQIIKSQGEGKAAACWQGAAAAKGNWLLFLDADTFFEKRDSLASLAHKYQTLDGRGILSAQPFHQMKQLYEHLSFVFNVVIMAGLNAFSAFKGKNLTSGAFGPCILCAKSDYVAVNGHQGMEKGILDDIALAKRFQANGLPIHLFGGRGVIAFRMHPAGIKQLMEGWTKDFATAAQSTHPVILACIVLWVSGGLGVGVLLLSIGEVVLQLFYGLFLIQCLVFARRLGSFRLLVLLFYPLLFLFFLLLFAWSLIRTHWFGSVSWKGRRVKL